MKMSVKRAAAALLASAMMLSLTACGGGGETETSAAGGETSAAAGTEAAGASEGAAENASAEGEKVVKIAYTSDPGSLGTFDEGSSSGRWTVLAYTYENLLYMGSDGEYFLSAITSGGSQGMFFKMNTMGEEAFLETIAEVVDSL